MALWVSGVDVDLHKVTACKFHNLVHDAGELRNSLGEFCDEDIELEDLPMLKLSNGTKMTKSFAILNWVANKYSFLKPEHADEIYRGDQAVEYFHFDFY